MRGDGLGFEREKGEGAKKEELTTWEQALALKKKTTKGSRAPIMQSLTIHAQQ